MRPSKCKTLRQLRKFFGNILDLLLFIDHITASKAIYDSVERITTKNSLLIFHLFPMERKDYEAVFEQLLKIRALDVDVILSINRNSKYLHALNVPVGLQVVERDNRGFDLGAFTMLIRKYEYKANARIFFMNDSIDWGEFGLLKNFRDLEKKSNYFDFVGLFESFQKVYHIQSFAFACNPKAALSYSRDFRNWRFKRSAVRYGELRGTKRLLSEGYTLTVIHSYVELLEKFGLRVTGGSDLRDIEILISLGVPLNPMQHFWREAEDLAHGIIKYSALSNPAKLKDPPTRERLG
jgi:hypothetical protein